MDTRKYYEPFLNRNLFLSMDQVEEVYGNAFRITCANSLIVKDEELFTRYKNEDIVEIKTIDGVTGISKKLVHDLLSDEGMYKYVQTNLINSNGSIVRIDYIIDAETIISIKITASELLEAFNKMFELDELTQKEKMRKALIENSLKIYSFTSTYRNRIHSIYVDGKKVDIITDVFIALLSMNEETYNAFLSSEEFFGYKKEVVVYGLIDFIERERILSKYAFDDNIINRINSLKSYNKVDYESINQNRKTNDENVNILDTFSLNSELVNELIKYVDPKYSKLEKAVYYYIRLCELLTYNKEYFILNNSNVDLEEVSSKNNEVTSIDFLLIYAKLLKDLGIYFTLEQTLVNGSEEGLGQITFKDGEYLVAVDSVANINTSDLINVKINGNIMNLYSINTNDVTRNKFKEMVERIYKNIIKQKEDRNKFEYAMATYETKFRTYDLSTKDRLYMFLKTIARPELKGIDLFGYVKRVFDNILGNNKKIGLTLLVNPSKSNEEFNLTPIMVVSLLSHGEYTYFVINTNDASVVQMKSQEEVKTMVDYLDYYYINSCDAIPGLEKEEGRVYDRRINK